MSGRVFIWVGHPSETSLSHGLADAYQRGAESEGAQIRRQHLHDMHFDPDLTDAYRQRKELEPCLNDWRENMLWADHVCWIYPQWWGGMPAKMKGVLDRAFLPGFAMEYHTNDPFWTGLLKGRSADVIMTADAPHFYDQLRNGAPALATVRRLVLNFSGIRPVRTLQVGTVKTAKPAAINRWMRTAYNRGCDAGRR